MRKRLLSVLLASSFVLVALVAFTSSAAAEKRLFEVRLLNGQVITVTVDVPPGTPIKDIALPGQLIQELPAPQSTPAGPLPGAPGSNPGAGSPAAPESGGGSPQSGGGSPQSGGSTGRDDSPRSNDGRRQNGSGSSRPADSKAQGKDEGSKKNRKKKRKTKSRLRRPDGTPTRANPTFFDALPGPTTVTGVPNFVIRKFRVPLFLLPIYQAAGIQYGVRWEYLAAINEIETDYGRNLNVSSAGALGWMQFMPATWRMYGVDANGDKKKDPYNPVDAIFASARYLKAAGAPGDMRKAIFAYNHADWYVDSVLLRARLIAGLPSDLIGSLTGLTEGRFPIAARAKYADDLSEKAALKRVKRGENAANVINSNDSRRGIEIFAKKGAPVVAVGDGVVKKIGVKNGRKFIVIQDAYGNRYTYENLGEVSRYYPVPKDEAGNPKNEASAVAANTADPAPTAPASAGRHTGHSEGDQGSADAAPATAADAGAAAPRPQAVAKQRLFAHPTRENPSRNGGVEQAFDHQNAKGGAKFETYRNYFSRGLSLSSRDAKLKRLKKGSRVISGTVLARVGGAQGSKAPNIYFQIRPAGRGAPSIDPKPILDGWKLLESTAIYRASGKNALYGKDGDGFSIGQIMLLPKPLLEKRVLSDERVEIYPCGRRDIKTGQIDRRVLATIEYLAESGMRPTITSLKCGHGFYTASGNVSHHSSGNAVDVAKINGIPILGHQDKGSITEQAVERLMLLQGTMRPDQIISLLDIGANTVAMGDHDDHIHIGWRPLFGENKKLGQQAMAVLKPGQWNDLIGRLRQIENPTVPVSPSKYAIPVKPRRGSDAHPGE
jgi:murein DD-endopeptidase MepM/ murein hydrolase activator NlpD